MNSTQRRKEITIKEFNKILKAKGDYTTEYMYQVVADKVFCSYGYVKGVINKHYKNLITQEMIELKDKNLPHYEFIAKLGVLCNVKTREARFLSRYIKTQPKTHLS